MPELLEVEAYRGAAEALVGRTVRSVDADDARFLRGCTLLELRHAAVDRRVVAVRRHGKLLLIDLADSGGGTTGAGAAATVGLHFGMTGRLVIDGVAAIGELRYGPAGDRADWIRASVVTDPSGGLAVVDPRRLGSIRLDPDLSRLGPDAAGLTADQLAPVLRRDRPLKALLLDQSAVAGLGNLLVDESLWRAGIRPDRPARSLAGDEAERLAVTIVSTVRELGVRGGSHTGDLQEARDARGACPRCGQSLSRGVVGGRSTVWCPREQD